MFLLVAFILLMNLLIAMMGDTYTRIAEIKNEWMRQASCMTVMSNQSDKKNKCFSVGHDGAHSRATDPPQHSAQGAGQVLGEDGHGREGARHEADHVGE